MQVRERIARNTMFNAGGRFWDAAVSLGLMAYIVHRLGAGTYGIWAVVGALTGYATLLDVGVGSGYAKFIAEHEARDEREAISSVVSTGFYCYIAIGGVFVSLLWPLVGVAAGAMGSWEFSGAGRLENSEAVAEIEHLVRWGLVLFAVSNCIAPFTAVQTGLQRMGVTNAISVAVSLVKVGATIGFLEAGYGIRGLLYANAAVLVVFAFLSFGAAFVLCPSLCVSPGRVSSKTFRKLFHFGWRTQVSRLSNLIMFETDVLVIALFLRDFQLVGMYRVGVELANKMRQVPALMLTALLPAAAQLDATERRAALRALYLVSTKYVAIVTFPLVAMLAGAPTLLIRTWMGDRPELAASAIVLQIMACGYIANILPGGGVAVALGMGEPGLQMKAGLISMSANVALTIALAVTIGFWGIPIATVLSMAVSWAWFSGAMERLVGVGRLELWQTSVRWPLVAALPGVAVCLACNVIFPETASRMVSGGVLTLAGTLSLALYLAALRLTPIFDTRDFAFLDSTLRLDRVPGFRAWSRPMRQG